MDSIHLLTFTLILPGTLAAIVLEEMDGIVGIGGCVGGAGVVVVYGGTVCYDA